MIKKLFSFLTVLICLWSCKAEKVTIPSYIQINDYTVKTNYVEQGTSDQKFTDMLVYANGTTYGTFPVGKPIPVLANGSTKLLIRGVVEINGVSALRADYELMAGCDTVITLTQGKTTIIKPVFEYFPAVVFRFVEDFDGNGGGCSGACGSKITNLDTTSHIVPHGIGGGSCLILRPDAVVTTSQVNETTILSLPSGGVGVYMEFNYYSNVAVNLGITAVAPGTNAGTTDELGGVYPSPGGWNKAYIDLTEQVSNLQDASGYNITIYSVYDASVGPNFAYIDNIKVISKQ